MQRSRHRWDPVCDFPASVVRPVRVDPTGQDGPTRGRSGGPGWRRTGRGLFVPVTADPTVPEQRIVEAAARLTDGVVTGWAACRLHGATFFDGTRDGGRTRLPVPLVSTAPHQVRRCAGDDLRREQLAPADVTERHGIPCAAVPRATFDAMRWAPSVRAAVVALDMMCAARLTSLRRMAEYVGGKQGWTGVQKARDALALADEHAKSPPESRLRLVWQLDAGRGRPRVNPPLFDVHGRLLCYPDLIDPVIGVVGEYDGDDHRSPARHSDDVDRQARMADVHLEVFRVTGPDLGERGRLVRRIESAYRRAERRTRAPLWTLRPPPGWTRDLTLDQVLDARERADPGFAASA